MPQNQSRHPIDGFFISGYSLPSYKPFNTHKCYIFNRSSNHEFIRPFCLPKWNDRSNPWCLWSTRTKRKTNAWAAECLWDGCAISALAYTRAIVALHLFALFTQCKTASFLSLSVYVRYRTFFRFTLYSCHHDITSYWYVPDWAHHSPWRTLLHCRLASYGNAFL